MNIEIILIEKILIGFIGLLGVFCLSEFRNGWWFLAQGTIITSSAIFAELVLFGVITLI